VGTWDPMQTAGSRKENQGTVEEMDRELAQESKDISQPIKAIQSDKRRANRTQRNKGQNTLMIKRKVTMGIRSWSR